MLSPFGRAVFGSVPSIPSTLSNLVSRRPTCHLGRHSAQQRILAVGLRDQFVVRALLNNPPGRHYADDVRVSDGREPGKKNGQLVNRSTCGAHGGTGRDQGSEGGLDGHYPTCAPPRWSCAFCSALNCPTLVAL